MTKILAAAAALLWSATSAVAHHAFASEYDENRRVSVSGTVTRFEWSNPHAWLYLDTADPSGKPAQWSFEMGSPGGLTRRGWRKTIVKPGDRITIEGFGAKDGRNVANAGIVTFSDGHQLFGGFQTTPGPRPK